ncbi:MAG: hypothetical protein ABR540_08595 [Acidimicrobiales bacterium]
MSGSLAIMARSSSTLIGSATSGAVPCSWRIPAQTACSSTSSVGEGSRAARWYSPIETNRRAFVEVLAAPASSTM